MNTSWKTQSGSLACNWAEAGDGPYSTAWMEDTPDAQGSHLEAVPDFASHSPFGGPTWFEPQAAYRTPRY
jgi:hypothetical protein